MGLNFPTAFWKGSNPSDSSDGVSINWDLYLYYTSFSNVGAGEAISSNGPAFSAIANSAHPYQGYFEDYFRKYPKTRHYEDLLNLHSQIWFDRIRY